MKMSSDRRQRRWVHEEPGNHLDAELGEVFRATAGDEPLTAAELERVARRLRAGKARRSPAVFRLLPVMLAVLTGGAGAALAQWARPGIWDVSGTFAARSAATPRAASSRATGASVATSNVKSEPTPAAVADDPSAPPETAAPDGQPAATRVTPDATVAQPNGVALESELLQRALEKLRRDHDAAGALRLLDEYGARFPGGELALEAAVARVDALLMLGRRGEALERLAELPLARVGRRAELQLLRAELQAERDCSKALADFDAVLGAAAPLAERALYGRATCRLRLGDASGGRRDLEQYLTRYPQGRFAEQVRARFPDSD